MKKIPPHMPRSADLSPQSDLTRPKPGVPGILLRILIFAVASSLAVCFPLTLGKMLWNGGLSAGAEYIFWLASGVNVAFLLILGWRYWPVILVGILPAMCLLGEPLGRSVIGASGNCIEALVAYVFLHRVGRFTKRFDRTRTVIALALAATFAPLAGSLVVPGYLVYAGTFSTREFWMAVGNWNLANGVAILVLAPFFIALYNRQWVALRRPREALIWLVAGLACGFLAFDAVFEARGLNFAFLIFPFVIFVATRFGPEETSAALVVVMLSIYGTLAWHAAQLVPAEAPAIIWFVQACFWVLAVTGLIVAALGAERREMQELFSNEQKRVLEASLGEERARLDALKNQINPHFLFNALNSVRATLPLSSQVPREIITELAQYLRSSLDRPSTDLAPLEEEVRWASHYLDIEKRRFGDDLQVSIEQEASAGAQPVPVFLIQPLVENAIIHGFQESKNVFHLKIRTFFEGDILTIEVANTGVWKERGATERQGLGLANIRRRLELLYEQAAHLHVESSDGWVRLRIEIPRVTIM